MSNTSGTSNPPAKEQWRPPDRIFKTVSPLVRALLRSPLQRALSGKLMVLEYKGRSSGRTYSFPIGYYTWSPNELFATTSARWFVNLRGGRPVRLLIRGQWRDALGTPVESTAEKAELLLEFARRLGPKTARGLLLGLPRDRLPTPEEAHRAAERTTIVLFQLTEHPPS